MWQEFAKWGLSFFVGLMALGIIKMFDGPAWAAVGLGFIAFLQTYMSAPE